MHLYIRKVISEDCDLLFTWANDDEVRKNSFNEEKILYSDHVKWFNSKLKQENFYMFICLENDNKIGQIRIDIVNDRATISYSIAREFRGKNYAVNMLKLLEQEIIKEQLAVTGLVAYVKYTNVPSLKVFQKLHYDAIRRKDRVEFYKKLHRIGSEEVKIDEN